MSRNVRIAKPSATSHERDHVARIAGFTGAESHRFTTWILLTVVSILLVSGTACSSPTPKFLQGPMGEVNKVFRPVLTDVYGDVIEPSGSLVADSGTGQGRSRTVFVDYRFTGPVDRSRDIQSELASRLERTGAVVNSIEGSQTQFSLEYSALRISGDTGSGTVRVSRTGISVSFETN